MQARRWWVPFPPKGRVKPREEFRYLLWHHGRQNRHLRRGSGSAARPSGPSDCSYTHRILARFMPLLQAYNRTPSSRSRRRAWVRVENVCCKLRQVTWGAEFGERFISTRPSEWSLCRQPAIRASAASGFEGGRLGRRANQGRAFSFSSIISFLRPPLAQRQIGHHCTAAWSQRVHNQKPPGKNEMLYKKHRTPYLGINNESSPCQPAL